MVGFWDFPHGGFITGALFKGGPPAPPWDDDPVGNLFVRKLLLGL